MQLKFRGIIRDIQWEKPDSHENIPKIYIGGGGGGGVGVEGMVIAL